MYQALITDSVYMQVYDCNIFFSYRVCTDIEVNLIVIGSQVDNKLRWLKRTKYLPLQNPQSLEIFYVHWLSFHLKQYTIANEEFIFIWQTIYDNCTHLKKKINLNYFSISGWHLQHTGSMIWGSHELVTARLLFCKTMTWQHKLCY